MFVADAHDFLELLAHFQGLKLNQRVLLALAEQAFLLPHALGLILERHLDDHVPAFVFDEDYVHRQDGVDVYLFVEVR